MWALAVRATPGAPELEKKTPECEHSGPVQSVPGPVVRLSVPEIRRRLWRLLIRSAQNAELIGRWSHWRCRHQWLARERHGRRHQPSNQNLQL